MLLEILVLVLFSCLIVYFVISVIVFVKFRRISKINKYLIKKYNILNRKSFLVDRALSLHSFNKVSINEVNESFIGLYNDIVEIDHYLNKE